MVRMLHTIDSKELTLDTYLVACKACIALLENRFTPFEVDIDSHPWLKEVSTFVFLQASQRRDGKGEILIEKFQRVLDTLELLLPHWKTRTRDGKPYLNIRPSALDGLRHFGFDFANDYANNLIAFARPGKETAKFRLYKQFHMISYALNDMLSLLKYYADGPAPIQLLTHDHTSLAEEVHP